MFNDLDPDDRPGYLTDYILSWAKEHDITEEHPITEERFYGEGCIAEGDNDELADFVWTALEIMGLARRV